MLSLRGTSSRLRIVSIDMCLLTIEAMELPFVCFLSLRQAFISGPIMALSIHLKPPQHVLHIEDMS